VCKQGFLSWSHKSYFFSACFWSNLPPLIIFLYLDSPSGPRPSPYRGFEITLGRISLDESSARRRDHHLKTSTHNRETSMPPVEFEPTIPISERRQTHALDSSATRNGPSYYCSVLFGRDRSTHCIYAESVGQNLQSCFISTSNFRPTHPQSFVRKVWLVRRFMNWSPY